MSRQVEDHFRTPDLAPGDPDAPLRAKKSWHTPQLILPAVAGATDKTTFSVDTSPSHSAGPS